MDPAIRLTHPTAVGRIQRSAGWGNRLVSPSWETPEASDETGDASNRKLDAFGEDLDGGTGPVSTSGEMPEALGGPVDAPKGPLDTSGEALDGEPGPVSASGELPEVAGDPVDAFNEALYAFGEAPDGETGLVSTSGVLGDASKGRSETSGEPLSPCDRPEVLSPPTAGTYAQDSIILTYLSDRHSIETKSRNEKGSQFCIPFI
jgi:hypothetical protein